MNQSTITLTLKNIGPFSQAEIELKPITIITGESSTGKTYLLKLLYILLHSLDQAHRKARTDIFPGFTSSLTSTIDSLSKQMNIKILRENTTQGEIILNINTPHKKFTLHLIAEEKRVGLLSAEVEEIKNEPQPITKILLIPEDRLFSLKYILPATLELISKTITELPRMLQTEKYGTKLTIPESLKALSRFIPQYTIELLSHTLLTIINPTLFNEAIEHINKTIQNYGTIKPELELRMVYTSKLGYQTDINTAPEAIGATIIPILPLPSFLRQESLTKLVLIDHIETNLTPPLIESLIHTLIEYITKTKNTILIMTAHNLDTLVCIDTALREHIKNIEEQVNTYELKLEKNTITCTKLPTTTKTGIQIPEYLDKYTSQLGNKQARLLTT